MTSFAGRFLWTRYFLAPGVLLCLSIAPRCSAQAPAPSQAAPIRVRVDVVNVGVTVTDAQGRFVGDLQRENFRLFDNGAEQPLSHFASIEQPAQVLLLVETGPAVYLLEREHLLAAFALLSGLSADDQVALAGYDEAAHPLIGWTQDKQSLASALQDLRYNLGMGELRLFESVKTAVGWLAPLPGKKVIVLLSTGVDTSPVESWAGLEPILRTSDIVILPVALGAELRAPAASKKKPRESPAAANRLSFEEADRALNQLAAASGGRAFFPRSPRDFRAIYAQVASLVRHQYSLGFSPAARDGQIHKLEVRVVDKTRQPPAGPKGKPLYRVDHRQAYLAPPS